MQDETEEERVVSMKVNFHTIEFMSAGADMGCKYENLRL